MTHLDKKPDVVSYPERKMIFFIGPVRCGTTWLYAMLKKNTLCSYIPGKEIYFFEKAGENVNIGRYFSKFIHRSNIYIDLSPTYFASEEAAKKIKAAFPYCLIIIIKRNPLDIAVSWYRYAKRNGKLKCGFEEFLTDCKLESERNRFRYSVYLPIWEKYFRKEQIVYLDYKDFLADPVSYFLDICDKIGITPSYGYNYSRRINDSAGQPRLRLLYRIIVWIGRSLQSVFNRQRLLRWKIHFFDKIFIDRSFFNHIPAGALEYAEKYYKKDWRYINTL